MADWSSYFARMEGAPISIAVDLAYHSRAPLEEKPAAYTVAVEIKEPDEHGMTTPSEYRALQAIEEELAEALEPHGIIEVGRVTGRGMRTFHYYGPTIEVIAAVVSQAMQAHDTYRYRALSASDPTWTIYTAYLYPDGHQLAFANDMKALQALLDAGGRFRASAPDRAHDPVRRRGKARRVRACDAGPRIRDRRRRRNKHRTLLQERCDRSVQNHRDAHGLTTLAEEFGGLYSGWATVIQLQRQRK